MQLKCTKCGHEYDGTIEKKSNGWRGTCPSCGKTFDPGIPKNKRIVMAFTDPVDDDEDPYRYFTDDFEGKNIWNYFAYDTPAEFITAWKELLDKPNGMWYWVMTRGRLICSGAMDPGDIHIFEEVWRKELGN